MTHPFRLLGSINSSATISDHEDSSLTVSSDFVVILAVLLCALICVLGLIAVARCAWLRRFSTAINHQHAPSSSLAPHPSAANKGLKKKMLQSLPKQVFSSDSDTKISDCVICLCEFVAGDEIRVLPQCRHEFHLRCIDTWLGSHSSCPSCRQILAFTRCQECGAGGGMPESSFR